MKTNSIFASKILTGISAPLIIGLSLTLPNVQAAQVDFNISAPTTGSVIYSGGNSALVGSNIDVDNIVGLNTPLNNNVLSICATCTLNFTTGNFESYDGTTWTFMGGGSIEVIGGVDFQDLPVGEDIPAGTTLLSGTFNEASVVELPSGTFEFSILGGSFIDTKDPQLLAYYGLPDVDYQGGLNISFEAVFIGNPGGFESTQIFSGDIVNTPVPLPAGAFLFLSAVGVLSFFRRK